MAEKRTQLLLVRHGQTPWNASGRWQGNGDPGLTELGREQAELLCRELVARKHRPRPRPRLWRRIISSDLKRAQETASILARALGLEVELDHRFRELDVGRWTGLTRAEIEVHDPTVLRDFESGDPSVRPGGGESRIDIRIRARGALRDWTTRYSGEPMILVAHLGVIRALLPGEEPANGSATEAIAEEVISRPIDIVRRPSDGPL